ncbi:MAG: hypothetical protein IH594_18935, partial [Bacteroidales bacterium]|nr:hypothetical protein [Bacteroidales bacterium]
MVTLLWTTKEVPGHYFTNYLFKIGMANGKDFLPIKFAAKIAPRLNDQRFKEVLDNKLYFDLYYNQFNVRIPKTILFNHGKRFVSDSKAYDINNLHDFKILLQETFAKNPSVDTLFAKKIYSSSKGANIYKISSAVIDSEPPDLHVIFGEIFESEFLFQEAIRQHKVLDFLNPSSVNTLRLDTLV